jgi:hypothetical protein
MENAFNINMKMKFTRLILIAIVSTLMTKVPPSFAKENACADYYWGHSAIVAQLVWGNNFNFNLAEQTLRSSKDISLIIPMKEYLQIQGKSESGTSEVYYVEFKNGLKAVWKPDEGIYGAIAEEAAYFVAKKLGVKTFVPTIVTEIDGRIGSLSVFVKTPIDIMSNKVPINEVLEKVPLKQLADMDLVHYLLGQYDRHLGNLLVDEKYNLAVIDNEGISNLSVWKLGEYPFVKLKKTSEVNRRAVDQANFPYAERQFINGNDPLSISSFINRFQANPLYFPREEFDKFPDRAIPFVVWRGSVWRPRFSKSFRPITLEVISKQTLDNLKLLTEADLRSILYPVVFSDEHMEFILKRRNEIINKAATSHLIR